MVDHLDINLCGEGGAVVGLCQLRGTLACLISGDFGQAGSALWRGSFRFRRVRAGAALRHGLSGLAMGSGAALIPGGNDGLILFGLPALSPHALPAWASIVVGTALSMVAMRAFDWPMSAIHCEADICRATL